MKNFVRLLSIIVIIIIAYVIFTRNTGDDGKSGAANITASKTALINIDNDFAKAAAERGTGRAFIDFADEDVVLLRQNQFSIKGKKALEEHYKNRDTVKTPLVWKPVKADVSPDGHLGYTYGKLGIHCD